MALFRIYASNLLCTLVSKHNVTRSILYHIAITYTLRLQKEGYLLEYAVGSMPGRCFTKRRKLYRLSDEGISCSKSYQGSYSVLNWSSNDSVRTIINKPSALSHFVSLDKETYTPCQMQVQCFWGRTMCCGWAEWMRTHSVYPTYYRSYTHRVNTFLKDPSFCSSRNCTKS